MKIAFLYIHIKLQFLQWRHKIAIIVYSSYINCNFDIFRSTSVIQSIKKIAWNWVKFTDSFRQFRYLNQILFDTSTHRSNFTVVPTGEAITTCEDFTYLGSQMISPDRLVTERRAQAWRASYLLGAPFNSSGRAALEVRFFRVAFQSSSSSNPWEHAKDLSFFRVRVITAETKSC